MIMNISQVSARDATSGRDTITASTILEEVKRVGVEYVITVPDRTTSESVLLAIEGDQDLRHIKVCKEDEAFGISAGLSFCDKRSLVLIQNTGLLDSINALRAIGAEYGLPACVMVGLLDKESDRQPKDSANYGVRIVEPILDAMGITHHLIETQADAAMIGNAIARAYETSTPVALLLGRPPRASA